VGAIAEAVRQHREMVAEAREAGLPPPPPPPAAATRQIASELLNPKATTAAYISDAMLGFLAPLRGASGKVRFTTMTPGAPIVQGAPSGSAAVLKGGAGDAVSADFTAPDKPGVYK